MVAEGLKRLAPESVVVRPLVEKIEVVTTAAAWHKSGANPALNIALEVLRSGACHKFQGRKRRV